MENTRYGQLELEGGTCHSCMYTIEHAGRKIKGIQDIYVEKNTNTVHVEYTGSEACLEGIQRIVKTIGYNADIISTDGGKAISQL